MRHLGPAGRFAAVLLVVAGLTGLTGPTVPAAPASARVHEAPAELAFRQARTFALAQLARTDRRLAPGRFPTVAVGDSPWRTEDTSGWLAGFWPGRLWLAYELDGRRHWARRAAVTEAPLAVRQDDTTAHDLGFLIQTSFGRGAALVGATRDASVTLHAAAALASRYVPSARVIRCGAAPAGQVAVIVDNLMNLELLFWAARHGGRPEWRDIALQHALSTARWHLRADGSTFQVVRFDESTGQPVWQGTAQGVSDTSTWARGQAWAVHGFTTAYRETGDARLLAAAREAAGFVVTHAPADGVPWWDYAAPGTRRDTTAAAVQASGLLELARIDPDAARPATWRAVGLRTLRSLGGPANLARGPGARSILLHGRHDPTYDDAGVTYADYYLLEALLRVQLLPSDRAALPLAGTRRGGGGGLRADLGARRRVSAVSVRWAAGAGTATRYRVLTSLDGRSWTTVRGGVSSGRTASFETYDLRDRVARFVRVVPLGTSSGAPGRVAQLRVRG
jgi:unsaturated chondroitin disaccharide hydrolase